MDDKIDAAECARISDAETAIRCAYDMDTSSAPPAEQFALFNSWHKDISELGRIGEAGLPFLAHEKAWDLGKLSFMFLSLFDPDSRFRWRHIKRPTIDSWYLMLPLSKTKSVRGQWSAGKLSLACLAKPFEYETEDDAFLALFIPNNLPFMQTSKLEIRAASEAFLIDYMQLLHRSLPDLRIADIPHIATATSHLLAACLSPSRDHMFEAQRSIDAVLLERASRIIIEKLDDRNLTPDRLCRELGMSRSHLYRIFEPVGGVSNYIRRRRLAKTHDVLRDQTEGRSISTVAETWGFTDPSSFSRMFRREFGVTPKEARLEGWLGAPSSLPPQTDRSWTLSSLLLSNFLEVSGSPH